MKRNTATIFASLLLLLFATGLYAPIKAAEQQQIDSDDDEGMISNDDNSDNRPMRSPSTPLSLFQYINHGQSDRHITQKHKDRGGFNEHESQGFEMKTMDDVDNQYVNQKKIFDMDKIDLLEKIDIMNRLDYGMKNGHSNKMNFKTISDNPGTFGISLEKLLIIMAAGVIAITLFLYPLRGVKDVEK